MKQQEVFYKFNHKDRDFVLRLVKVSDAKKITSLANSLVKEKAIIKIQKRVKLEDEIKYLKEEVKKIEKKERLTFVIEENGYLLGVTAIKKKSFPSAHIGDFGILLKKEARNMKLGQKIIPLVLKEAKKQLKIKIAQVTVFGKNKIATHVYGKCGFKKVGEIKKGMKFYNKYLDKIIMTKDL